MLPRLVLSLLLSPLLASAAPAPARTWEKVLLTDAAKTGAVCLDGTPGGYYISRGADPTKWIVFHQGGGWCSSLENCAARAGTKLGSSSFWGPTYTDTYEGSQLFNSPTFAKFTVVYAMYCDGGSWTGNAAPVSAHVDKRGNITMYYRGRPLLDAMLDHLLATGLSKATQLLYGGCSAGGLTSYLHADYVASKMPSTTKTLAIADAMFAVESLSYNGTSLFPARMSWGYEAWNSSASVNAACLAANPGAQGYRCMFGSIAAGFVKTPMFVLNSKYDTWQEKAIIGADDTITKLPAGSAQRTFWIEYGHKMVALLDALPPQHGAFVMNCASHCQTGTAHDWTHRTVNGTAMGAAFASWYESASAALAVGGAVESAVAHRWIERCDDGNGCPGDQC